MGAKAEALAAQIEGKARDAVTTLQKLGDGDWKKVTAAEKWTVGATAHHLAGGLEAVAGIVSGIVTGAPPRGGFTRAVLDQMNAQHAREHADCARAETLALFQKGAAAASAVVRGLSDDQLAKSGTVFTDAPPMTAEQLIMLGLVSHIDEHMGPGPAAALRRARAQPGGVKRARRQCVHDIPTARMAATLNMPSHEIAATFSIGSQPQLATSQ